TGRAAVDGLRAQEADVAFLDVQMPEGNAFDVIREVGPDRMPVVVFVTAYDRYALRAFEVHAVDYLLKPFDRARFREALRRARLQVQARAGAGVAATGTERVAVRSSSRVSLV